MLSMIYLGRAVLFTTFIAIPLHEATVLTIAFLLGLLWLGNVPLTSGLVSDIFETKFGTNTVPLFHTRSMDGRRGSCIREANSHRQAQLRICGARLLVFGIHLEVSLGTRSHKHVSWKRVKCFTCQEIFITRLSTLQRTIHS